MSEVSLFSDGGGERGSAAAAACIIDAPGFGERKRLVIALGGATNNESEIFGGLAGLGIISSANPQGVDVTWFSDSEYTLKSGTQYILNWQKNGWRTSQRQPVKNLGMWKAYLHLTKKLEIQPEHVRGHSGHPENEECDQICTLVQQMQVRGEFKSTQRIVEAKDGEFWVCVDGRAAMESLRADEPDVARFAAWLAKVGGVLTNGKA